MFQINTGCTGHSVGNEMLSPFDPFEVLSGVIPVLCPYQIPNNNFFGSVFSVQLVMGVHSYNSTCYGCLFVRLNVPLIEFKFNTTLLVSSERRKCSNCEAMKLNKTEKSIFISSSSSSHISYAWIGFNYSRWDAKIVARLKTEAKVNVLKAFNLNALIFNSNPHRNS